MSFIRKNIFKSITKWKKLIEETNTDDYKIIYIVIVSITFNNDFFLNTDLGECHVRGVSENHVDIVEEIKKIDRINRYLISSIYNYLIKIQKGSSLTSTELSIRFMKVKRKSKRFYKFF